jgi:hypothetical protein
MTDRRRIILPAMAGGVLWAVAVLWLGQGGVPEVLTLDLLAMAIAPPGAVLVAMIGRLAQRRFFDDDLIDGEAFVPNSPAGIDQRVLTNTVEQIVLALCLWPFIAQVLGAHLLVVLGWSFALARILFWAGYHLSPPLRGLGFAATFYPTVIAALWVLAVRLWG